MTIFTLDEVVGLVPGVSRAEIVTWIEARLILPQRRDDTALFEDIDIARVRLIVELRELLPPDEDPVPLVLTLLDRMYGLRNHMSRLLAAIARQSPEIREEILAALRAVDA
jgi:chaperone modulatory protein CbpM